MPLLVSFLLVALQQPQPHPMPHHEPGGWWTHGAWVLLWIVVAVIVVLLVVRLLGSRRR